jgi:uncharacterized protein (DUF488 family)
MKFYTIGYGGRTPADFLELLVRHGVRCIADVRLRPDRAAMGSYTRAKAPDKGIEGLLAGAGIGYRSILELGNLFLERDDWQAPYRSLLDRAGDLLVPRLEDLPRPFCLLCAEKRVTECHRLLIAEFLVARKDWEVVHIE